MIDGLIDGLSGKSAPFFWLIAFILVGGLVSNSIFFVRFGMESFRMVRRFFRGEKNDDRKGDIEGALK